MFRLQIENFLENPMDGGAWWAAVHGFRCVFPLLSDPRGMVDFHVDYGEFARSITGRCVVHHGALPKGVISCTVTPDVVECVETADE